MRHQEIGEEFSITNLKYDVIPSSICGPDIIQFESDVTLMRLAINEFGHVLQKIEGRAKKTCMLAGSIKLNQVHISFFDNHNYLLELLLTVNLHVFSIKRVSVCIFQRKFQWYFLFPALFLLCWTFCLVSFLALLVNILLYYIMDF